MIFKVDHIKDFKIIKRREEHTKPKTFQEQDPAIISAQEPNKDEKKKPEVSEDGFQKVESQQAPRKYVDRKEPQEQRPSQPKGVVKQEANPRLKDKLKDDFDFTQHQLSQETEESKQKSKPKADNDEDDFFDNIGSSTTVSKEEKMAANRRAMHDSK